MALVPITFTSDPLPESFGGSMEDLRSAFISNLRGTILTNDILSGRIGGIKPTTNIGPWLRDGKTWYVWSNGDYVPAKVQVGDYNNQISLDTLATADHTQLLQDKDGTIALTSDIFTGPSAVTLTGTSISVDWNLSKNFTLLLTGDSTLSMINSRPGQEISVLVRNSATSYAVTWAGSVFWQGGAAPTQTASATDLYLFQNIGGSILARQLAGYNI